MSSKLSDLPSAGALLGGDLLYVARAGVSYQTSLDDLQSAIGGEFNGVVQTYADLPVDGSAAIGEIWLVRESTGTWLINRKQRGLYQRIDDTGVRAADWQYLGEWLEEFSDANFALYNSSDNTKGMKFSLSGIATGQTRTLTVPDADGTILISTVAVTVPQGGTGRTTSTTAYGLIAAGTTATGAHQTLAAGATTEILVGGGASALPVWTTANGTGAPVRTTNAALVTPNIGTPSAGVVTNLTGTASININGTVGATTPNTGAFTSFAATGFNLLATSNSLNLTGTDGIIYRSGGSGTNPGFHRFRYFDTDIAVVSAAGITISGEMNGTFSGATQEGLDVRDSTDTTGAVFAAFRKANATIIGSIQRVTTTDAVAYNTTSDGRLKTNVRDFTGEDSGRIIDALRPRWFDWKQTDLTESVGYLDAKGEKQTRLQKVADSTRQAKHSSDSKSIIGFIAQEEAEADPALVRIGAVTVGDSDPDTIARQWSRSDSALVPIIVAELKALRARFTALETARH